MQKIFDLAVVVSKYTARDGQEKSRWENIGAMFEKADGHRFIMLKASFNPAAISRKEGSDSIAVSLFTPKKRDDKNNSNEESYSEPQDYSDKHDFGPDGELSIEDCPF